MTINAIGPETFTYRQLLATITTAINVHRPIVGIPPWLGHLSGLAIGRFVGDVIITKEIKGLMADLLYVNDKPVGTTRLTDWIRDHAATLGMTYASELARRG